MTSRLQLEIGDDSIKMIAQEVAELLKASDPYAEIWLPTEVVAQRLGVTTQTVINYCKSKRLTPSRQNGSKWQVLGSAVDAFGG